MRSLLGRYRFTREEAYRRRIRAILRKKNSVSLAQLGKDNLLPRFVFLSPDWRDHVNSTARTSPRPARLEDLRLALVYLNALILDNIVIPNSGVDFGMQLLIEVAHIELISNEGLPFNVDATLAVCDGLILISTANELSVRTDEHYWVDRVLWYTERKRTMITPWNRTGKREGIW